VKLKKVINLIKEKKTIKRMKTELNKINHKLRLRDVIENNSKVYKRVKKKIEIKRIKIKINHKSKDNSKIFHG
jgi:hypothetical protein